MSQENRHGTAQGWKPGGKIFPKKKAAPIVQESGPRGKGQMNEGEPRWSGDPKPGP
jgi:hypothetical protein